MIVSTCGFGSTGSSAVSDYLLECENTSVFDNVEFTIATVVDGLEDLEYHLMLRPSRQGSGIIAIQRFRKLISNHVRWWTGCTKITKEQIKQITDNFINSIVQLKFIGDNTDINKKHWDFFRHYFGYSIWLHRIIFKLERKHVLTKNRDYYPFEEIQASVKPQNFYIAAKTFIKELLTAMGADLTKILVLDQAFAGNDPAKSFPFYDDPYAIVVDRDPRDIYIFAKKVLLSRGRFMPTDTVENFITYYKMLRDNQPYKEEQDRVLRISFEEMVYDYDNATKKINDFLNVTNKKPKTIFNPSLSVANTNLIRKYPEFKDDIKKIEEALPEYLYHFENYPEVQGSTEMFYGKSPLNKK